MKKLLLALLFLSGCNFLSDLIDKLPDIIPTTTIQTTTTIPVTTTIPTTTSTTLQTTSVKTTTTVSSYNNPQCTKIMGEDGYKVGFVYKPISDSDKMAVVVIPGNFQTKFNSCSMTRKDGQVDKLRFTAFANYDGKWGNKLRQTWRAPKPGSYYMLNSLIVCVDDRQTCKWQLKDPSQRHD